MLYSFPTNLYSSIQNPNTHPLSSTCRNPTHPPHAHYTIINPPAYPYLLIDARIRVPEILAPAPIRDTHFLSIDPSKCELSI